MVKRAFFSFHYKNDVSRANIVRNSWVTQGTEAAGFIDKAEFEKIRRTGDEAIKRWIDNQLKGTSVTVVLIGSETLDRPYVKYEIEQSYKKGNAIIGVKIGKIKDLNGNTSVSQNHVKIVGYDDNSNLLWFNEISSGIYDYVDNNGYNNLGTWIKNAHIVRI